MQKPYVIIALAAHIIQVRFLIYDLQSSLPQLFPNYRSLVAAGQTCNSYLLVTNFMSVHRSFLDAQKEYYAFDLGCWCHC